MLQADLAEKDSIDRIRVALSSYQPIQVEITNCRSNGQPFKNLLTLKLIYDLCGVCR